MLESIKIKKEVKQMKQVFVSYHYTAKDGSVHGFGNAIEEFDPEMYEGDLRSFILNLQADLAHKFEQETKIPCNIKVMFWR